MQVQEHLNLSQTDSALFLPAAYIDFACLIKLVMFEQPQLLLEVEETEIFAGQFSNLF